MVGRLWNYEGIRKEGFKMEVVVNKWILLLKKKFWENMNSGIGYFCVVGNFNFFLYLSFCEDYNFYNLEFKVLRRRRGILKVYERGRIVDGGGEGRSGI